MIFLESFRTTWNIFSIYKVLVFLSSGQGLPTPEQLAMKRESIVVLPGLTNTIDKKENRKDKKGNTNKILKLKLNWFFQLGQMKSVDSTLLNEPITKMDSVARKWIGCYLSVWFAHVHYLYQCSLCFPGRINSYFNPIRRVIFEKQMCCGPAVHGKFLISVS